MTIDDLKKLDKQIKMIPDPFGRGFQTLKMTFTELAERNGISATELTNQYLAWKWKK